VADASILDPSIAPAPKGYLITGSQEIVLKSVTGSFDGTGAAAAFVPSLQIIDPSGFIVATFPVTTTLAAGGSADVSWFPGLGGGGSVIGAATQAYSPPLDTPDSSGFTFPVLSTAVGFSNVRRIMPALSHGGTGSWVGTIRVPPNYGGSPVLTVTACTASTTGAIRWTVGTAHIPIGTTEDTAFTDETPQNVTVPGSALRRFDVVFPLTTAPNAGDDLNFRVTRQGANAGDTCTGNAFVWTVLFTYAVV
jgi:hypothetical protein